MGEKTPYILDQYSILYHGSEATFQGKAKIVDPTAFIEQVIEQHPNRVFAGHQGVKRKQNYIKLHCF